jgi:7-cyano-7-deazaguanine synthase
MARYAAEIDVAVGVDYGQPHAIELQYAARIADHYNVFYEQVSVPSIRRVDGVVFAARNAVLLSVAASIAAERECEAVMIGCNFTDAQRFPDCRPQFIREMDHAFSGAYGVRVFAPLLTSTKTMIVQEARRLGVPDTWTCYAPTNGQPCGTCLACEVLKQASSAEMPC